jgi:hypothetical protein
MSAEVTLIPIESPDRCEIIAELHPACPVGCQLKSRFIIKIKYTSENK